MSSTITRVYDDYETAQQVVTALEAAGFPQKQISIVSPGNQFGVHNESTEIETGTAIGGIAGASAGLLVALGIVAVPGLGPLVAAGALATILTTAVTGSVAGGLVGALVHYGHTETDAQVYAEAVKDGASLVSVQSADSKNAEIAKDIMDRYEPIDLQKC